MRSNSWASGTKRRKRAVRYLTPYPPTRSGIADYASCFKQALAEFTDWRLEVAAQNEPALSSSLRGLLLLYRRVLSWKTTGLVRHVALVHAEIGDKQYDEFYTLFWLRYLIPSLPYCMTIHDPPLAIMPVLQPLSLGMGAKSVRRALRVLDYTPLGRTVLRSVLSHAAGMFVLSEAGKTVLQRFMPSHAGIYALPFINHRTAPRLRQWSSTPGETTKIFFMGFWNRTKGIEILLQALERLTAQHGRRVQLLMAGGSGHGDSERAYITATLERICRSPIEKHVAILGYLPPDEMEMMFDSADICVLPYTHRPGRSSSSVLFRAMAAGMAIVVSDLTPLNEEIRHLETGIVVPPGNVDALVAALLLLVDAPYLRVYLGQRAQQHAFTEHAREHVAQLVAERYELAAGISAVKER